MTTRITQRKARRGSRHQNEPTIIIHPTGSAVMADDLSAEALNRLEQEADNKRARLEAEEIAEIRGEELSRAEADPFETTSAPFRPFADLYKPDE
jgi:hypothetical protein